MDDKKSFVENDLKSILQKIDRKIKDVNYIYCGDFSDIELVCILYKDKTRKYLNITWESELSIMYHVTKRLLTD